MNTWTHSVKFPAIKKVISDCAISKKKKKGSSRRIYSCFFTHNGITTPKTTREGQESTTKPSLYFAWPPKFKNEVLFTPRAQNRFLDLGLLLRGCRPKSRSLPRREEVIQPVVRACTTFWLTSTRITLPRVHRSHITVSLYELACLSEIRSASRFKKWVAAGPAPPVHEKIKGTNEACSTSRTRWPYFRHFSCSWRR